MKKSIWTSSAPQLFSSAILTKNEYTMEISGQIGIKEGKVVDGFEEQTKQAFMNVLTILQDTGRWLDAITKVRTYLTDMSHYAQLNEIYAQVFDHISPTPSRVALAVKELPLWALIELDCTAVGDKYERKED